MSENPEIQKLDPLLLQQIEDINLRVLAMQTLLQQQGLLKNEAVEARISELRQVYSSRFEKPVGDPVQKQATEDLWKLLGEYGGREE